MNSVTITVPWLPILVCLGVVFVSFMIRGAIGRKRGRNRARKIASEVRKANQRAAEADELSRKLSLFPFPWDQAYKQCCAIEGYPESRIWLKKWLREHEVLPSISIEAITEIAGQLTFKKNRWQECLDILAPYVDVGCSTYVADSPGDHGELKGMT